VLPANRAVLSLLGHCYYHQGLYESACSTYETLVRLLPEIPEYRLYHAQSLYKAGDLTEASRVAEVITAFPDAVEQLKVAIAHAADQPQECRRLIRAWSMDGPATSQNEGCILYLEGKYRYALHQLARRMGCSQCLPCVQRRL
jgi:tetratricopeptide repeat protein 30